MKILTTLLTLVAVHTLAPGLFALDESYTRVLPYFRGTGQQGDIQWSYLLYALVITGLLIGLSYVSRYLQARRPHRGRSRLL